MHTLILVSRVINDYSLLYVSVLVHIDCMPLRADSQVGINVPLTVTEQTMGTTVIMTKQYQYYLNNV